MVEATGFPSWSQKNLQTNWKVDYTISPYHVIHYILPNRTDEDLPSEYEDGNKNMDPYPTLKSYEYITIVMDVSILVNQDTMTDFDKYWRRHVGATIEQFRKDISALLVQEKERLNQEEKNEKHEKKTEDLSGEGDPKEENNFQTAHDDVILDEKEKANQTKDKPIILSFRLIENSTLTSYLFKKSVVKGQEYAEILKNVRISDTFREEFCPLISSRLKQVAIPDPSSFVCRSRPITFNNTLADNISTPSHVDGDFTRNTMEGESSTHSSSQLGPISITSSKDESCSPCPLSDFIDKYFIKEKRDFFEEIERQYSLFQYPFLDKHNILPLNLWLIPTNILPQEPFHFEFTSTSTLQDSYARPYVVYNFNIEYSGLVWRIRKRYNDFFKLHNSLLQKYTISSSLSNGPSISVPNLPPKSKTSWRRIKDAKLISERGKMLLEYLQKLLSQIDASSDEHILSFIGMLSLTRDKYIERRTVLELDDIPKEDDNVVKLGCLTDTDEICDYIDEEEEEPPLDKINFSTLKTNEENKIYHEEDEIQIMQASKDSTTTSPQKKLVPKGRQVIYMDMLKRNLGVGDIILFRCANSLSGLQRIITGREWDHVAVIVKSNPRRGYELLEATSQGVTCYPAMSRLKAYSHGFVKYMAIRKYKGPLSAKLNHAMMDFVDGASGKSYKFSIFRNLFSKKFVQQERHSIVSVSNPIDDSNIHLADEESDDIYSKETATGAGKVEVSLHDETETKNVMDDGGNSSDVSIPKENEPSHEEINKITANSILSFSDRLHTAKKLKEERKARMHSKKNSKREEKMIDKVENEKAKKILFSLKKNTTENMEGKSIEDKKISSENFSEVSNQSKDNTLLDTTVNVSMNSSTSNLPKDSLVIRHVEAKFTDRKSLAIMEELEHKQNKNDYRTSTNFSLEENMKPFLIARQNDKNSYFCSELVAVFLQRMEIIKPEYNCSYFWPGHFGIDGELEEALVHPRSYGEEIILDMQPVELANATTIDNNFH